MFFAPVCVNENNRLVIMHVKIPDACFTKRAELQNSSFELTKPNKYN